MNNRTSTDPFNDKVADNCNSMTNKLKKGKWLTATISKISAKLLTKYIMLYFFSYFFVNWWLYFSSYLFVRRQILFELSSILTMLITFAVLALLLKVNSQTGNNECISIEHETSKCPMLKQLLDYQTFYRQKIVYNRMAFIVVLALYYLIPWFKLDLNDSRYYSLTKDYFFDLSGFLHDPLISFFKYIIPFDVGSYTSDSTLIQYWISTRSFTMNLFMLFFYFELIILSPILLHWINKSYKYYLSLTVYFVGSNLFIFYVVKELNHIRLFQYFVTFTWIVSQIALYIALHPIKNKHLMNGIIRVFSTAINMINLLFLNISTFNLESFLRHQSFYSKEFEFVKTTLKKCYYRRYYNFYSSDFSYLKLVKFILLYIPATLSFVGINYVFVAFMNLGLDYITVNTILFAIQLLSFSFVTKKFYSFKEMIPDEYILIEDFYKIPIRIIDYKLIFSDDHKYNRLALVIVMSIFAIVKNIYLSKYFVVSLFMIFISAELMIIGPIIFSLINTRLKHMSILLVILCFFGLIFLLVIKFNGNEFWFFLGLIYLWVVAIRARNDIFLKLTSKSNQTNVNFST